MKITSKSILPILFGLLLMSCSQSNKESMNWEKIYTEQGLEKVNTSNTNILVDLRYSTDNNFIGEDVYGNLEEAYLQPEALQKLNLAADVLKKSHPDLKILIWDAARPRRIQQVLWDTVDIPVDERSQYVANPTSGSIHNYGCAVDLTLADTTGKPIDMGTDYDNFSEAAHITNETDLIARGILTRQQVENRLILRSVMLEAGFFPINSEWWHFDAFTRKETKSRFKIVE